MKSVLIIGGAGFIGTNLIKNFVLNNYAKNIIILDNFATGSRLNLRKLIIDKEFNKAHKNFNINISTIEYDITNSFDIYNSLIKYYKKIDEIYYLANLNKKENDIQKLDLSYIGTKNVLDLCIYYKCKLLYLNLQKFSEISEQLLVTYEKNFDLDLYITRLPKNIYIYDKKSDCEKPSNNLFVSVDNIINVVILTMKHEIKSEKELYIDEFFYNKETINKKIIGENNENSSIKQPEKLQIIENEKISNEESKKENDIIKEIIAPKTPIKIYLNELCPFIFRGNLDNDEEKEKIIIYLAKDKTKGQILCELGYFNMNSKKTRDYMTLWVPKISDGIEENGGNLYYLILKRAKWWGWKQEIVYESEYICILPKEKE